MALLGDII